MHFDIDTWLPPILLLLEDFDGSRLAARGTSLAIAGALRSIEITQDGFEAKVLLPRKARVKFIAEEDSALIGCTCRGHDCCEHIYVAALRLAGEAFQRGLAPKEQVRHLLPDRWLKPGAHLAPVGGDWEDLFSSSSAPMDRDGGGNGPRTAWWQDFLDTDSLEKRQRILRQVVRQANKGAPLYFFEETITTALAIPNPVSGLERFLRNLLNLQAYFLSKWGKDTCQALHNFLQLPDTHLLRANLEARVQEQEFVRWLEEAAPEAPQQQDVLEVQWTLAPHQGNAMAVQFTVLLTSKRLHRSPRTQTSLEQLHRAAISGNRKLGPYMEPFLRWILERPQTPVNSGHLGPHSLFWLCNLNEWRRRWGHSNLFCWEDGSPVRFARDPATLATRSREDGALCWAATLPEEAGGGTHLMRELTLVFDIDSPREHRELRSVYILRDGMLVELMAPGVPERVLRAMALMETIPVDQIRGNPAGAALCQVLRTAAPQLTAELVQEVPVRVRAEFRVEGKALYVCLCARDPQERIVFERTAAGWRQRNGDSGMPAAAAEDELVVMAHTDAPAPAQALEPTVEELAPEAICYQPRPQDVAPIDAWFAQLSGLIPVSESGAARSTQYSLRLNNNTMTQLYQAWPMRPRGADYFGDRTFQRMVQHRSISALKIRVEQSGVDFFQVSVDWAEEMDKISPSEVEAALAQQDSQLVQLTGGFYVREELEQFQVQVQALAGVGLTPEGTGQRLHALHLSGEAGAKFLEAAQGNPALEELRREAHNLVAGFRGVPRVRLPKESAATLRPYQRAGVDFLVWACETFGGALLADDMGLGKTLQVLTTIQVLRKRAKKDSLPSLVVSPASVAHNWEREAQRFTPDLRVLVLERGHARHQFHKHLDQYDLIVKNYALTRRDADVLKEQEWLVVCVDEAQAIKNPAASISQTVKEFSARFRIALTGTPIENRLMDLWSILDFTTPGYLPDMKVLEGQTDQLGSQLAFRMLRAQLRPVLLRRLKQEVAPELPPRIEERRDCTMLPGQRKLYLLEVKAARKLLDNTTNKRVAGKDRIQILAALTKLRQICCDPAVLGYEKIESGKTEVLLETLAPLIEAGEKVLVFSQFVRVLHRLDSRLKATGVRTHMLTGDTTHRGEVVDAFENDPGPAVFLISLKAGGTGLNLTSAAHVILFDPWWNPAAEAQAIDRTHRIGQKRTVLAFRLVAEGTIEERILELQEKKRDLVKNVFEAEGFNRALTREDFQFLLSE